MILPHSLRPLGRSRSCSTQHLHCKALGTDTLHLAPPLQHHLAQTTTAPSPAPPPPTTCYQQPARVPHPHRPPTMLHDTVKEPACLPMVHAGAAVGQHRRRRPGGRRVPAARRGRVEPRRRHRDGARPGKIEDTLPAETCLLPVQSCMVLPWDPSSDSGHADRVQALVAAGADVHARRTEDGAHPAHAFGLPKWRPGRRRGGDRGPDRCWSGSKWIQ